MNNNNIITKNIPKAQELVTKLTPAQVNSNDININPKSTSFFQQHHNMQDFYNQLNILKDKPHFKFLVNSILMQQALLSKALQYKICENNKLHISNCIFVDKQEVYCTIDQWDELFNLLVMNNYGINKNPTGKIYIKQELLYKYLLQLSAKLALKTDPSHKKLKVIIADNVNNIFINYLKSSIISIFLTHNNKITNHDIKLTSFNIRMGALIYGFIFYKADTLKSLYELLSYSSDENILKVSADNMQYFKWILNNDKQALYSYYSKAGVSITEDILDIINTYVLDKLYTAYSNDMIQNKELYQLLQKTYNREQVISMQTKLLTEQLKLGTLLTNILEECNLLVKTLQTIKYKTTYYITLNSEVYDQIMTMYKVTRPLLTETNLQYILVNKEKNEYTIMHDRLYKSIHPNANIKLTMNVPNNNIKYIRRYTVDREFLLLFLQLLDKQYMNSQVKDYRILEDPTYTLLLKTYNLTHQEFDNIKHETIRNKLYQCVSNFNSTREDDALLFKEIQELPSKHLRKVCNDLYSNILQQKRYFIFLIEDSIIYAPFKYFIHTTFIDSRGRLYSNDTFTDVNGYPQARMFIKLFTEYEVMKPNALKVIKEVLNSSDIKQELTEKLLNKTCDQLIQLNNDLIMKFIIEYFHNVTISDIKPYIESTQIFDLSKVIQFANTNIKKDKNVLVAISEIHYQYLYYNKKHSPYITNYYELDANTSGLQMISILTRNIELGKLCNLIGEDNNDLYKIFSITFKDNLKQLHILYESFTKQYGNQDHVTFDKKLKEIHLLQYKKLQTLDQYIEAFLSMNLELSTCGRDVILVLLEKIVPITDCITLETISSLKWCLPPIEQKILQHFTVPQQKSHLMYLMLIRVAHRMAIIYKSIPLLQLDTPFWNSRNLFKKAIMTYFYNSTSFGRKEDFILLLTPYISHKYSRLYLTNIMERFFHHYITTQIPDFNIMSKITKKLLEKNTAIVINNPLFKIVIKPFIMKSITVNVKRSAKDTTKRSLQLRIQIKTNNIDRHKLHQTSSPNIIHSMDAFLTHKFMEKIKQINETFVKCGIQYNLSVTTNHDNFVCNNAYILSLLLKDCYYDLIHLNYIQYLSPLTLRERKESCQSTIKEYYKATRFLNPHFMK